MDPKHQRTVTAFELDDLLDTRHSYQATATEEGGSQAMLVSHESKSATKNLTPGPMSWQMVGVCVGLLINTVLSVLLLFASRTRWTVSEHTYWIIVTHRPSVQLIVQVVSNALAIIYSSALCMLINYASRIYWNMKGSVRLDVLRFWRDMCAQRMDFDIPIWPLVVLMTFIGFNSAQSALWAGALTPVVTTVLQPTKVTVPSYHNVSLIDEYPSEVQDSRAPADLRGVKGHFTYKVGVGLTGELLRGAASATPVDNQPRKHQKNDNSLFTYIGRSYGVGSSIGLFDDTTPTDTLALGLTYQEIGFDASVNCIYNASTGFVLELIDQGVMNVFAATGEVPNSVPGDPEYSTYVGWNETSIVAIGVGRDSNQTRHTLSIAAGKAYGHLNGTQCEIFFVPTLFDVTVSFSGRNISVNPTTNNNSDVTQLARDTGYLKYVLTRQFELIANAQTNLYASLVGNSLKSSIADYLTVSNRTVGSLKEATTPGLANAVTVMTDDMLVGYAQAQLMIGGFTATTHAVIQRQAMRVGEDAYVYAVFVLNILIILAVLVECLRTRGWKDLVLFDYMEVEWLTVGGFKGGVLAANGDDNEIDLVHGTSPNEWSRLDVTLKSLSGDSFVQVTKRIEGLL